MKKLALALACLVTVAFFASCDPTVQNPEPKIQVLAPDSTYLTDGDVVDCYVDYNYGFRASSNPETMKDLAKFVVTYISDSENAQPVTVCDTAISGQTFDFVDAVYFEPNKEIIGVITITATVTDIAGETNSASIKIAIDYKNTLDAYDFSWVRKGANLQGDTEEIMAAMGLQWGGSYKDIYATIKPLNDNCKMYALIDSDVFETITTEAELSAFFSNLQENTLPTMEYRHITTNNSADYNDIIAVVNPEGIEYLIHITHAAIETGSYGTQITITGQYK